MKSHNQNHQKINWHYNWTNVHKGEDKLSSSFCQSEVLHVCAFSAYTYKHAHNYDHAKALGDNTTRLIMCPILVGTISGEMGEN